ncbi:glycine betaine ABC transporter substrate-binding protein [Agrococcus jejuensis]|uniref:glycine betaine ABC transporter substrate-binding protein n=1 Tax=Agrococcus jejuensis TaxID=399736 RepID=UPI00119EB7ED|nr:glycine betaine ABC transporter substrate-binding protein [Agrococcus jejuensis]
MHRTRLTGIAAIGAAAALALTGCATGNQTEGGSGEGSGDSLGTITLGFLPSWTDGLSTAYLLENQLEQLGYTVEMQELTEAGPLYTGLAQGDVDIYPSAWPELTHASYMEEYGDSIEDLGTYYEGASLNLSVPDYVDITSIDELVGQADRFGGQIVGIEPGAGLTAQTESMMPEAGLDDYELVTSSTAAMLAELDTAIAAERDIVVTSWAPYWANEAYDLRALEDPNGLMGGTEGLHFLGTDGFADEFPEAAEYIAGIQLTDEQYASLEDMVVNEYGDGREAEAIEAWLEANPDAFDTIVVE